jgi:hypothetical protein
MHGAGWARDLARMPGRDCDWAAPYLLARANAGAQKRLTHAVWSAFVEKGWNQHAATTRKDVRRLTNCGGSEAAWVVAMPTGL